MISSLSVALLQCSSGMQALLLLLLGSSPVEEGLPLPRTVFGHVRSSQKEVYVIITTRMQLQHFDRFGSPTGDSSTSRRMIECRNSAIGSVSLSNGVVWVAQSFVCFDGVSMTF
jgi:hypothetical protein